MEKNIKIEAHVWGKRYDLETYAGEYRNLMMLIYDKLYVEEFGECKGVGRCGTCHIYMLNIPDEMVFPETVAQTTLSRLENKKESSYLACQIMIDSSINGLVIEVADDTSNSY